MNTIATAGAVAALMGSIGGGFLALEAHFLPRTEHEITIKGLEEKVLLASEEIIILRIEHAQDTIKKLEAKDSLTQAEKDLLEVMKNLEKRLIRRIQNRG